MSVFGPWWMATTAPMSQPKASVAAVARQQSRRAGLGKAHSLFHAKSPKKKAPEYGPYCAPVANAPPTAALLWFEWSQ